MEKESRNNVRILAGGRLKLWSYLIFLQAKVPREWREWRRAAAEQCAISAVQLYSVSVVLRVRV